MASLRNTFDWYVVAGLLVTLFFAGCWMQNLYKFSQCDFEPNYKAEAMYGMGIVLPTFLATAFMDFGK